MSGTSCNITLVPGGASGVVLYSKAPLRCASAKIRGLIVDGWRRSSVVVAMVMSRHHRCIEKEVSTLERPAMRWYLKIPMEFSALLVQCKWGETSWKIILLERNCRFSALEHSLFRIFIRGINHLLVR